MIGMNQYDLNGAFSGDSVANDAANAAALRQHILTILDLAYFVTIVKGVMIFCQGYDRAESQYHKKPVQIESGV